MAFAILAFCAVPISNHGYYCTIAVTIVFVAIPVAVVVAVDNAWAKIYEFRRDRRLGLEAICVCNVAGKCFVVVCCVKTIYIDLGAEGVEVKRGGSLFN